MTLPSSLSPSEPPRRSDQIIDLAVGLGGALLCLLWVVGTGYSPSLAAVPMALALIARRTSPPVMLIAGTFGALLVWLVLPFPHPVVLAVPLIVYAVARWASHAWARGALVVGLVGSFLGPMRWIFPNMLDQGEQYYSGDVLFLPGYLLACLAGVLTPYLLGRRRAEAGEAEREQRRAETEATERRIAESEQRARLAEVTERQRIARELHDIVAHSLSVIIVQAEGARALTAKRPELAAQTLGTISEIGREALGEIRRITGVLRGGPEPARADFQPAAGLADIPDLVARTGPRAHYQQRGELPVNAHPTLGLTAYRIVQEGLTNVLKHAGPDAQAYVLVDGQHPGQVRVQIVDDGLGVQAVTDGLGNGLQGMFERVHTLGGTLIAQPKLGGGFLVRAVLPLPTEAPMSAPLTRGPSAARPGTSPPGPERGRLDADLPTEIVATPAPKGRP